MSTIQSVVAAAITALGQGATVGQIRAWLLEETEERVASNHTITHSDLVRLFGLQKTGVLLNTLESLVPTRPDIRALVTLLTTGGSLDSWSADVQALVGEFLDEDDALKVYLFSTRAQRRFEALGLGSFPTLTQIAEAM